MRVHEENWFYCWFKQGPGSSKRIWLDPFELVEIEYIESIPYRKESLTSQISLEASQQTTLIQRNQHLESDELREPLRDLQKLKIRSQVDN